MGVAVFVGLLLLDIRFALTLGLLAGILALIPILGGFAGAVPGLLVTLATDPQKLLWVALLYFVVQFVKSNIISPEILCSFGAMNLQAPSARSTSVEEIALRSSAWDPASIP